MCSAATILTPLSTILNRKQLLKNSLIIHRQRQTIPAVMSGLPVFELVEIIRSLRVISAWRHQGYGDWLSYP